MNTRAGSGHGAAYIAPLGASEMDTDAFDPCTASAIYRVWNRIVAGETDAYGRSYWLGENSLDANLARMRVLVEREVAESNGECAGSPFDEATWNNMVVLSASQAPFYTANEANSRRAASPLPSLPPPLESPPPTPPLPPSPSPSPSPPPPMDLDFDEDLLSGTNWVSQNSQQARMETDTAGYVLSGAG